MAKTKNPGKGGSPSTPTPDWDKDWPKPGTRPKPEDRPTGMPGDVNPFLVMRKRGKGKFVNDPTTGPKA